MIPHIHHTRGMILLFQLSQPNSLLPNYYISPHINGIQFVSNRSRFSLTFFPLRFILGPLYPNTYIPLSAWYISLNEPHYFKCFNLIFTPNYLSSFHVSRFDLRRDSVLFLPSLVSILTNPIPNQFSPWINVKEVLFHFFQPQQPIFVLIPSLKQVPLKYILCEYVFLTTSYLPVLFTLGFYSKYIRTNPVQLIILPSVSLFGSSQ